MVFLYLYRMKEETIIYGIRAVIEAIKAGVDILWIGARTTVSPFIVQDIADALESVADSSDTTDRFAPLRDRRGRSVQGPNNLAHRRRK